MYIQNNPNFYRVARLNAFRVSTLFLVNVQIVKVQIDLAKRDIDRLSDTNSARRRRER